MWLGNNLEGLLSIYCSRSVLDGTCSCFCLLKIGILSVMESIVFFCVINSCTLVMQWDTSVDEGVSYGDKSNYSGT